MIKSKNTNHFTFNDIDSDDSLKNAVKNEPKIIEEITNSGLRGCGGAGFPIGLKLKLTKEAIGDNKYVICNADEGEPGTFKDRELFTNFADFIFSGMTIAALAINAKEGFVYLRHEYQYLVSHLENILAKRREKNLLGKNILQKLGFDFDIKIRMGAGAYVCGEETSLLESMEGLRGEPRNRPPFPVVAGYLGKPTCLSNVETFARIATVLAKGANWFSSVGTEKSKGHKLFSISGDCERPGVYEFPMGTTVAEILEKVGAKDVKAVQMGGASGRLLTVDELQRKVAFEDAPPGGSIIIFNKSRDLLEIAENFLEFFVDESCGQCTPCRQGNIHLLNGLKALKNGKLTDKQREELKSLGETMQIASKCGLGQSSPNIFLDVLAKI